MSTAETRGVVRTRFLHGQAAQLEDQVAREEPLEIRVAGTPLAVLLRTPGHDEELAVGFCLTEGVLDRAEQVDQVEPCAAAPAQARGNVVNVCVAVGASPNLARWSKPRFSNSACGVCGTATLDNLAQHQAPLVDARTLGLAQVLEAPRALGAQQPAFSVTGGLHAAGLLDGDRMLGAVREDVGRHNAVDKALGAWALQHGEVAPLALVTTSRAGFEIVQKAHARRVPVVITVGAPTSLAVELAERAGITLVSFVRSAQCSVYAHPQRVLP